jgi:DNA polymerase-3 subunit epsilon
MSEALPKGPGEPVPFDQILVGDTETTGLRPFGLLDDGTPSGDPEGPDRLCSAALIRVLRSGGGVWIPVEKIVLVIDPQRTVPEVASAVNGFVRIAKGPAAIRGRRNLAGLPTFAAIGPFLRKTIGSLPLAFHNAAFDAAVLDAEFIRAGLPLLDGPILCTKKAFSDVMGKGRPDAYVKGTNLNALCDRLGVDRSGRIGPDGKELHGAEVDALMAAACLTPLDAAGQMIPERPEQLPHRRRIAG